MFAFGVCICGVMCECVVCVEPDPEKFWGLLEWKECVIYVNLWNVFGFVCVGSEECSGAFRDAEVKVMGCEVCVECGEVCVGVVFHLWDVCA